MGGNCVLEILFFTFTDPNDLRGLFTLEKFYKLHEKTKPSEVMCRAALIRNATV